MGLEVPKKGSFSDGLKKQSLEEMNLHLRVGVIDNHTGYLRDDTLTDLLTSKLIEGRASFAKGAKRLNLITWMVTTNEPHFSSDIASRSAMIRLAPADRSSRPHWQREVSAFINDHGSKVAADCIEILRNGERHKITTKHSRFGDWDVGVLACIPTCNEVLDYMRECAQASDTDATEAGEFLYALLGKLPGPNPALNPDPSRWAPEELKTADLCHVWADAMGKELTTSQISKILRNALARGALPGLDRKSKKNGSPWVWKPWEAADAFGIEYGEAAASSGSGIAPPSPDEEF